MGEQQNGTCRILADIGGTHVRLALCEGGAEAFREVEKYKALDWPDFESLLAAYMADKGISTAQLGALAIASAVRPTGPKGRYIRFDPSYKNNAWVIDRDALAMRMGGAEVLLALDTQAQFHTIGRFHAGGAEACGIYEPLGGVKLDANKGHEPGDDAAGEMMLMVSVGTGLGHAYGTDPAQGGHAVFGLRPTFGGHMTPSFSTAEQADAVQYAAHLLDGARHVIFEDIVSGRGFYALYRFICMRHLREPAAPDVEALFAAHLDPEDPAIREACRLFCEFLGLYVNVVATSVHAFGGVYLIGSILRRLSEDGLLDTAAIRSFMRLDMVRVVDEAWAGMPVYIGVRPHLTLYGLAGMIQAKARKDAAA